MFKRFNEWFSKLEFSQKLCIWVMSFYGLFSIGLVCLYVFVDNTIPVVDLFKETIIVPVIELGTFGGKTTVENVQKIIKSKAESLLKIQSETSVEKTSDTI